MPSQRKRIGFLPSAEVQKIIDSISRENKLSQSKITGILVEEALILRGVLTCPNTSGTIELLNKYDVKKSINNNELNYKELLNNSKKDLNEEIEMINKFIEYKLFKNIMNRSFEMNK